MNKQIKANGKNKKWDLNFATRGDKGWRALNLNVGKKEHS